MMTVATSSIYYSQCVALGGTTENVLKCVSSKLEAIEKQRAEDFRRFLLLLCGALVFLMQAGFAMLCAGSVRKKNAQNTLLKNLLDAAGAAVAFFCFGYAFAFGGDNDATGTTFIGGKNFFNTRDVDVAFWFFQYTFSAASVTIVAGTLAERCQMIAYLLYSFFLTGFVYPVVAHAVWSSNGYLSFANIQPLLNVGMVDFAGSGVVHLTGGTTALWAACILGSRRGRFYDVTTGEALAEPKAIRGHSKSLLMLGTMILWFGWYGFNSGSALLIAERQYSGFVASHVAMNTSLSAASGGICVVLTVFFSEKWRTGESTFDLTKTMNGILSGLVAITSGCATVEHWSGIIIGTVAGWSYLFFSHTLIKYKIDDAVDAIPVHMCSGAWGLIATGLFSSPKYMLLVVGNDRYAGLFHSLDSGFDGARLLVCQIIGIVFISGWTLLLMVPFFLGINYMGWFRTASLTELVGLDTMYHGETAADDDIDDNYTTRDKAILDAYCRYRNAQRDKRRLDHFVDEYATKV